MRDAVCEKYFQKHLTICDKGGKISTLSVIVPHLKNKKIKTFQKNQKTFAKGIDKREEVWYNSRAVREKRERNGH